MDGIHLNSLEVKSNFLKIQPLIMQKLGYGTGVTVYHLELSPLSNFLQFSWTVKKIICRKIVNKEISKRIKDETDLLRKLKHPNILDFRSFIQSRNYNYMLAMEEYTISLGDLIKHRNEAALPPYPAKKISKVAQDTSNALQYLHDEVLILHCDIKSYTISICGDFDICKLCGFGLALRLTKEGTVVRTKLNENMDYAGSLSWCAPEVLKSDQFITTKADMYAFGLLLWEMMELSIPPAPEDNDDDDDRHEIVTRERPTLPNYDFGPEYQLLLEIFYCCTDEDLNKRPSAKDIKYVLEVC